MKKDKLYKDAEKNFDYTIKKYLNLRYYFILLNLNKSKNKRAWARKNYTKYEYLLALNIKRIIVYVFFGLEQSTK